MYAMHVLLENTILILLGIQYYEKLSLLQDSQVVLNFMMSVYPIHYHHDTLILHL